MDSLLSDEQKDKVTSILNQVSELSESEKHSLYLKLPDVTDEALSSKEQHCESSGDIPMSSFNFGKMMRLVFPNIHDRRLGQRGQSKYCYGGLRRKENMDSSSPAEVLSSVQVKEDLDLYVLSCQLVCEWATQLLGRPFGDIRILSEYLVSKGLSCGKTAAKFTLLSGSTSPPKLFDKDQKSPNSKHHERQMLLQRKLRHNKLIREHKEKLKQQQSNLWEQNCAGTARSSISPSAYPLRHDEQITNLQQPGISGRKIQLRPSSVQPYVWSVGSSHASKKQVSSFTHGLGYEREAILGVNPTTIGENVTQIGSTAQRHGANITHSAKPESTVRLMESLHTVPPKRCHSTSVVEKQSSSLHLAFMELTSHALGKCPSSTGASSGCEMKDGKALSSSFSSSQGNSSTTPIDIHIVSSSSEGVSNGMSPLASVLASSSGAQRNISRMLASPVPRVSIDGLLMPQHPKRYGDSISPDRSSLTKRKCTTSLGVTKQQSLEISNTSSENSDYDLPRLRPYSCPVSVNMSPFDAALKEGKYLSNHLFIDVMCKSELGDSKENLTGKVSSLRTATSSPAFLSDRRKYDERRKVRPEQQKKNASVCHFVQKPTVINRPKHIMTTITSCPDLKQVVTAGDISQHHQESISEKQSYNILNSLLSLNYDILSEPKASAKTLPTCQLSSSLTSSFVSTLATTEASKSILQGSPLRPMTNTSHVVENPSILSSLSSRSAFVPVTSHKLQVANSTLKETDIVMSGLSSQKQPTALIGKKDQDPLLSCTSNPQSVESPYTDSTHTLVKPSISYTSASESSVIPTNDEYNLIQECADMVSMKFEHYSTAVTSTSSSSSSSSSTLCRSGESTSSGCESVLTTPIPASTERHAGTAQVSVSTVSVKNSAIPTTCSVPAWSTGAQCKSSPSVGCTTPVMSPLICPSSHNFQTNASSSITPPKRASRNRFTPIRPKHGGGTNTPSPQKLGGMTTPSPQKKDIRPDIKPDMRLVSAILKEQRVKNAQDLLVNLANNYQGEVKLQMPAEFLGLSPAGKSKSSDVRVTIRSPSNSVNILHHKNLQPGCSDLSKQSWPLSSPTPPHKEITVIVEPVCQPAGHSTSSPALSSCLISTTSAQMLQSLPSPSGVQIVTHNLYSSSLLPKTLISPNATLQGHFQQTPLTLSSSEPGTQVIILPPVSSCVPTVQTVGSSSSKPIIVEDDKGNVYSLDQKSGFTVLPQNLQHCFKSSQPVDPIIPSSLNTSLFNSTSGLLNVSEIKGHVIGPDANGQTYLLVPNSEPVISTTTTQGFQYQQTSSVVATTLASSHTKTQATTQTTIPCSSATGAIKAHSESSSAFPSELSQLATNTGQNMSGQTLIQHNSGSSAFHKCLSNTHRRASNIGESIKAEVIGGECKVDKSSDCQPFGNNFPKCICSAEFSRNDKSSQETVEVNSDAHICDDIPVISNCQGIRKRKASNSQNDEHEDRKRLNSCRGQKEENNEDDDVFIVKIEDNSVSKSVNENSDQAESCAKLSLPNYTHLSTSTPNCDQPDNNPNQGITEEIKCDSKKLLPDTETLLGMIEDSKSMTVKETIKALNVLRAKQNEIIIKSFSTTNIDSTVHRERQCLNESSSLQDLRLLPQSDVYISKDQFSGSKVDVKSVIVNRPQSARCTSMSPYTLSDDARMYSKHQEGPHVNISKMERTGRRHISLNLESLESDALLDTEPTLDHRLVGDIKDVTSIKSDQKTSVGIAAKSARSIGLSLSSDRSLDYKNKSKQHKQDITASQTSLLSHKKDACKDLTCVLQKELVRGQSKHQNISTEQDCLKEGSKSQQTVLINYDEKKTELVSEQPRSMSCVRDILQHGARHGLLKCISAMGDKPTSEFRCQNLKALSLSNLNQSSVIGSKASEHPLLAQCLSVPCMKVLDVRMEATKHQSINSISQHENDISSRKQNDAEAALSKHSLPDNELPGDIADFITESMSCVNSYNRDTFRRNSLSTLLADLIRNGQNEREQKCSSEGQNGTVWRSISVPNTIPDSYYDFKSENRQKNHDISSKYYPAPNIRSQSTIENGNGPNAMDEQSKHIFSKELSSLALQLPWESLTESYGAGNLNSNPENAKEKDMFSEHSSQPSDCSASLSSGTFLSPIGPAKLTRRSSVERSSSGDRSTAKTPVECLVNKCSTERSLPRIRTHTDRTKISGDRSLTKTPVDRSLSMAPVDRTARKISRDTNKSPNKMDNACRDQTTATVLQQSAKERDHRKQAGNRAITKSPADKILSNLACEGLLNHRSLDGMTHQGRADSSSGDRSHNQTPISDAGYSSVSQTPISEVGYSSVSPSPVMMSIPGMFGECGRQEQTSPATIFMPLRSDSVMSIVNSSRSNDGVDCFVTQTGGPFRPVSDISQCLHRTSEEDCEKTNIKTFLFDKDSVGQKTSLQDIIDGTLLDHGIYTSDMEADIKRTSDSHSIRDTLSFLDIEKFMSVQLNCIPTPPCSPSASPQLLADTSQSPLSFSLPFSHTLPPPHTRQNWATPASSVSSHHFSSVTTISSHVTCLSSNSIYVMSSSPTSTAGQYSPSLLPNTSPSSYATTHASSSPYQYYPHPSPPFTPSLQRCLASPRCPTPCSHRSLMSPCCATACGDSNSAPNRFMPIQTSGILATSLTATQTYIQPIRPVVTLASIRTSDYQNSHISLDFSQTDHNFLRTPCNKSSPGHPETSSSDLVFHGSPTLNSNAVFKSDATSLNLPSCIDRVKFDVKSKEGDAFYRQRKVKVQQKLREDHRSERTNHPTLVLSLTGSIGTVSGQGMQAGWSRDIVGPASPSSVMKKGHVSSYPQHTQYWKSRSDRSAPDTTQERTPERPREDSPTYTETISLSLLSGQSSSSDRNIIENLTLPVQTSQANTGEVSLDKHSLLHSGAVSVGDSEGNPKHLLALSSSIDTLSHVNESAKLSSKQLFSSNVNYPLSYHSDFPFSLQLAKLSDQSRPASKDQQSQAEDFKSISSTPSKIPFHEHLQDKHDAETSRASVLSTMLQALAFASSQTRQPGAHSLNSDMKSELFHRVSDLPTAYYSGTAPNVDLTKTPFALTNLPTSQPISSAQHNTNESHVDVYLADLNSQLSTQPDCHSGNQDELDETLNVLKSLDSQYFQQDDDSNSPETTI